MVSPQSLIFYCLDKIVCKFHEETQKSPFFVFTNPTDSEVVTTKVEYLTIF